MELTTAYQYYLKAKSAYPYDLGEVAEMLDYALSYDDECAPALCLMGQIQMEALKDFDAAEHYFQRALIADPRYVDTYKYLSKLLIWIGSIAKAEQVIERSKAVKGMPRMTILERELSVLELKGDISGALKVTEKGILFSTCEQSLEYFQKENFRIKRKVFGNNLQNEYVPKECVEL